MAITEIKLLNYRNIRQMTMHPTAGINLLYGANGQGKTNVLEAIWLFTGMQSFREAKLKDCIAFGADRTVLELQSENTYLQKAKLTFGAERSFLYNGVKYPSLQKAAGNFRCVVFAPNHLYLFHDGPKARRALLNQMISQLRPNYASYLSDYEKLITSRNVMLRDYQNRSDLKLLLESLDLQLSKIGTWLTVCRSEYVGYLTRYIGEIYDGLSGGKEKLTVFYRSPVFGDMTLDGYREEYVQSFFDQLQQNIPEDLLSGHTGIGVHRDDLEFFLNGLPVKTFGSQGQQRSTVLALKLSEGEIIRTLSGESPVYLFDDVLSELDENRKERFLSIFGEKQVLLTCCDENAVKNLSGRTIFVRNGTYAERENMQKGG